MVAHGLPCGAFGKRKLEDLYASRACRIPVESGWEDQPILLASRPKGYGYQPGKPLKSSGLSARFVETLRAINIVGTSLAQLDTECLTDQQRAQTRSLSPPLSAGALSPSGLSALGKPMRK